MDERELLEIFGIADPALARRALTYVPYADQPAASGRSTQFGENDNEWLEFLGDSVLGMLIVSELYCRHRQERKLLTASRIRGWLRSNEVLGAAAEELGLWPLLRPAAGTERDAAAEGAQERAGHLADALEALLGASWLSGGLKAARSAFGVVLGSRLRDAVEKGAYEHNAKLTVRNFALLHLGKAPFYVTRQAPSGAGPDGRRLLVWESEARVKGGGVLGSGKGRSRLEAEQMAAKAAHRTLRERYAPRKIGG